MLYNEYVFNYIIKETMAQYRHEAEIDRLVHVDNPRRQGPLPKRTLKKLRNLISSLEAVGHRSEHIKARLT